MSGVYLALVRHGDYRQLAGTPSAFQPFPLIREGERQAKELQEKISEFCQSHEVRLYRKVYSSVLLRAWQTAQIFCREWEKQVTGDAFEIVETSALAERCVGSLANLSQSQIEEVLRDDPRFETPPADWKSNSHYRLPYPGAESLLEAGKRVADFINAQLADIAASSPPTLVLFIGHGAAFRHAAYHLGVLEFDEIAQLSMYHAFPVFFRVDNDGRWQQVGGRWKERKKQTEYTD